MLPTDEYDIGYRRPPVATQFKKGQSGNPTGRPRTAKGERAIAERVLGEKQRLEGQPRGARVWYATLELIIMKLKALAAGGQPQATTLYAKVSARHGDSVPDDRPIGFLVVPEVLTPEEWLEKYSPKDGPLTGAQDVE